MEIQKMAPNSSIWEGTWQALWKEVFELSLKGQVGVFWVHSQGEGVVWTTGGSMEQACIAEVCHM